MSHWRISKTILIVDDHPVVRKGIRKLLEPVEKFAVAGEAADGLEAIAMTETLGPDIVVLDLAMPNLGGIDTLMTLKRCAPRADVLVFTFHRHDQLFHDSLQAGARGYVCKVDSEHLLPALEAISRGGTYFSPSVSDLLSGMSSNEMWERRPLTERERQIVALVARGHSNKQIAQALGISIKTVETHRAAAMRKTGSNSASALTIYAARNGLVDL